MARRQAQNAADVAALAGGKQLAIAASFLNGPPRSGDAAIVAVHDFAANNGFSTVYSTGCDVRTSASFKTSWFDPGSTGLGCSATSGFGIKITVNSPATGGPLPQECTSSSTTQYNCLQVTIQQRVGNFIMGIFGVPTSPIWASATVFAHPPAQTFNTPPPSALYLYQPQQGCDTVDQQCFNESAAPSRQNLSCSGGNCPTLWVTGGSTPMITGVDGLKVSPPADQIAVQSRGDIVAQARATFCDPYNNRTCSSGTATGSLGYSLAAGSKLYCSSTVGAVTTTCSSGPPSLQTVYGNQATFSSQSWTPTVDTSSLPTCGALILNGEPVSAGSAAWVVQPSSSSCYPSATEPYTIQPGIYQYIVINHGSYAFESGLFDITAKAPVNTLTANGYRANGIDHSREGAADFDLCTGGQPNSCSNLTAGIWIGRGGPNSSYSPYVNGTASSCGFYGGGTPGTQGGGGDAVKISGNAVAFRFESGSAGFVSTAEVQSIGFASPGVGQMSALNGIPLLFDMENNGFIHLDKAGGSGSGAFSGLVYQMQNATGGGVEIDPGLANSAGTAALDGQVRAYSFTTFGRPGTVIHFTAGYGTAAIPPIATQAHAEPWGVPLVQSTSLAASSTPGMETLTVVYWDEWAMDAYDFYIKLNNTSPVFFSQGIWSPTPPPYVPLPPMSNNPGDNNPAYPAATPPAAYTGGLDQNGLPDWTLSIPNGTPTASTLEMDGNWVWGHESAINGAFFGSNTVTVNYTFPTPPGTTVTATIFVTDGDFCGDYSVVNATFNNVGQPNAGLQAGGSVALVQ
jgi:hypothetical protein